MLYYFLFGAVIFMLFGCQASYQIHPSSLPKALSNASAIELTDHDNKHYRVEDLWQKNNATVFIFFQAGCPCVKRYQKRIENLKKRFADKGISFIYVSSNRNERFKDVKTEFHRRSIDLPLLRDDNGQWASLLGAKGTPATAIVNHKGELIYLGWIDNERPEHEKGRIAYLEDALNELINHRPIKRPTSPMFGCPIRGGS